MHNLNKNSIFGNMKKKKKKIKPTLSNPIFRFSFAHKNIDFYF